MVRFLSASSALLVAAMVVMFVGCGDAGGDDTGSLGLEQMQTTDGQCNKIIANGLRAAQECFRSGCTPTPDADACDDVTTAFTGFFGNGDCAVAFSNAEINGLPGNASIQPAQSNPGAGGPIPGAGKHIGEVICGSVAQCGLCPFLPPEIVACEEDCPQ